ncbi:MAG: hypothetical protein ABEJ55_05800 [Halanaeroarchaeum sp.]
MNPGIGARRLGTGLGVGALALLAVHPASAHTGTTHGGVPHVILLTMVLLGLVTVTGARVAFSRDVLQTRSAILVVLAGGVLFGIGAIGLVEIQVVASTGPALDHLYPVTSPLAGSAVMVGSVLLTRVYWPDRPRYVVLGSILGAWILYPVTMPSDGVTHPLGYVLVLGLPVAIGYVLWRDAREVIAAAAQRPLPRRVGLVTGTLTTVIVAFSAGTLTVNPDEGINQPTSAYLQVFPVSDPLVTWPALEFYAPSVPFAGMISVGTVILFGILGGLVGLNAAIVTERWQAGADLTLRGTLVGALSTTGATACCCCAPAAYGVLSAILGTAASPVYWAFMDTSSPLSTLFLTASVLALTASAVYTERGPTWRAEDVPTSVSV